MTKTIHASVLLYSYLAGLLLVLVVNSDPAGLRVKRGGFKMNENIAGFSAQEQDNIVAEHNNVRRSVDATGMSMLTWDTALAFKAQNWAEQCKGFYNQDTSDPVGGGQVGEIIFFQSGSYDEVAAIRTWASQASAYTLADNSCSSRCQEYTQMVWADTMRIGCGINFCTTVQGSLFTNAYMIVCNYGPAGNVPGESPYEAGIPCSDCPATKPFCDDKLCSNCTYIPL